jgi:hypothetical protein
LHVVLSRVYKWSINPFNNPNPVYSHTYYVTVCIRINNLPTNFVIDPNIINPFSVISDLKTRDFGPQEML